jgi:methylenetetrahydrofolate dehydrogenase (NADP+)/methenyltetrahydrofolate cyclohydrolase
MSATIIDGKLTSETIRREIRETVSSATDSGTRPPGLAVVIVGEDPASQVYVRNKRRAAEECGFHSLVLEKPSSLSESELLGVVDQLNADPAIDGILVQLPLPKHINEGNVTLRIDPDKDVDGFHPVNLGRLAAGNPRFVACTPRGCQELLMRYEIETEGARAVVIGRSNIVGTPMALLLMQKGRGGNATVTVCHSRTDDIAQICRDADIIVAAMGKPRFVTADMVKHGATVIDVGINRIEDASRKSGTRLVGDVDFDEVSKIAGAITPVPGGVGPMTIAMLLQNTVQSWRGRLQHESTA